MPCAALQGRSATAAIPVIFITALTDASQDRNRGLTRAAVDYHQVRQPARGARAVHHLSLVRMDELRETRPDHCSAWSRAAEYKDNRNRHARHPHGALRAPAAGGRAAAGMG